MQLQTRKIKYIYPLFVVVLFLVIGPFSSPNAFSQTQKTDLTIVMFERAGYSELNSSGNITGAWLNKIKPFFEQKDLTYQISIMTWERALQTASTRDDVLLGYLDRTKSREDSFHWIFPIDNSVHYLMSRNDPPLSSQSKQQIIENFGNAVCINQSNDCDELKEFGFPEDKIWRVIDSGTETIPKLIERGRADFFIKDFSLDEISENGPNASEKFLPLYKISEITSYLAASKNLRPDLLAKLKN